ncbi:hypothetical protein V8Z74_14715 [Comamonas sp. w2-DMI]|uniref:hypothetical protein n=1 Tax=Comamonas sp. w2-DMI TaxID=3126391 RepID=UPI0032E3A0A7
MLSTGTPTPTSSPARRLLPRFPLGRVTMSAAAAAVLLDHEDVIYDILRRHSTGDWGDLCEYDKDMNEEALQSGDRLFSKYSALNQTFNVFTNGHRSHTSIELPSDY